VDRALLERLVREVVAEVVSGAPAPVVADCPPEDGCAPRDHKPRPPADAIALGRITAATPARVAMGRAGTRYLTDVYVQMRAEHAIALDAVHSELSDGLAKTLGALELATQATSKEEFLLHPDKGRRLDEASRQKLSAQGQRGADVVVVCGDGLSAWALERNGPELVPALVAELKARGFSVAQPLFVRRARIGVADEIGVLLQAKATAILVGERPGLGTGDSLSIYTAYAPRLGQDNAEKDCISNIRPLGIPPREAAAECADLLKKTFAAGGGGMKLVEYLQRTHQSAPARGPM
jgi:ethanolamine ammonia-lyase small subunit